MYNAQKTADIIKKLLIDRKITAKTMCQNCDLGVNTLSNIRRGDVKSIETFKIIADYLNVSIDYLLGNGEQTFPHGVTVISKDDITKIPVYGSVSAGNGMLAEGNIVDYEYADVSDLSDGECYFYLKVHGDSMYPIFIEGDYALVQKQTSVDSGSYAIVLIDDSEGVVKKVIYGDNWIELHSINPMYPVRRFENSDVLRLRIVGLVKGIKRKF